MTEETCKTKTYEPLDLHLFERDEVLTSRNIKVMYFQTIESTNNYAKQWSRDHKAFNALFMADGQTEGRGRKSGRVFYSPNPGIYTSLLLRDVRLEYSSLPQLTILTALSICESLDKYYKINTQIKWVNDIYLNEKKIVGILCESGFVGSVLSYVVIGFGINVYDLKVPDELSSVMSSLEKETGKIVPRDVLILDVVKRILQYISELERKDYSFIKAYEERNFLIGQQVKVVGEGNKFYQVLGVSDEGYLIVENEGELRYLNSQESSICKEERT